MVAVGVPGATPFGGHAGPVNCVAFSPDGATFVTGGDDGVLRLWDLAERRQIAQFFMARPGMRWDQYVGAVAFSPDGGSVAAGYDDGLQVWSVFEGGERPSVDVRGSRVWSVAYSPDGTSIAAAGEDGTVRVRDAVTGQERARLTGHEGTVFTAVYSPDGTQLASGGADAFIRLWQLDSGQEIAAITAPKPPNSIKHSVRSVRYSPDGASLVSGSEDGAVRVWDTVTGSLRSQLRGQAGDYGRVWCVAWSPDGSTIASGGDDGHVWRWDAAGYELPQFTRQAGGTVTGIAYSPDGSTVITASGDRAIRLWDAPSGTLEDTFTGHAGTVRLLAYSPDGTAIATAGGEDHTVRVWDAATGAQTAEVSGHIGKVKAIAYSPDGTRLATMDEGSAVHLWDTAKWQERVLETGRELWAGTLAYSRDGATIVTAARGRGAQRDDGIVQLWTAATGEPTAELSVPDTAHIDALALSPDGSVIAVSSTRWAHASRPGAEQAEHSFQLYAVASGQPAGDAMTSTHLMGCLAVSPDGASLAFADGDAARIWDIKGERPTITLTGHGGYLDSIAYSPDGTSLATASRDGTVRLWEAATGQHRATLSGHTQDVHAVAYSPDGNTLGSAGLDGTIRIWNPRNGEQVYGTGFRPARVPVRALAGVRSDSPSTADLLGVEDDVQTLAELIAANETQPPLAIALIGDWGTGKSSLMLQVEREVAALAARARKNPGRSPFAESIRQVRFNAWHYSDDKLWAGLVSRLFEALKAPEDSGTVDSTELADLADLAGTGTGEGEDGPRAALDEIRRLKGKRTSLQQELETWQTDKQQVEADLRQADDSWSLLRASARRALRRFRETVFPLGGWLVAIVVALVAWHYLGARIGSISTVFAVAGGPVAFMSRVQSAHQETRGFANKLRAELEDDQREDTRQIEAMQREIQETENQIYLVDAATWLQQFLDDRGGKSEYLRYQGLLGLVRADFEQLSEKLAQARAQWAHGGYVGPAPLERIVLYIDDLDRCPPHRVVEVLEAIHLMLALDLFVVVVAVDARWLIRSLEYHHRELFGAAGRRADGAGADGVHEGDGWARVGDDLDPGSAPGGPQERLATPIDYLDKIFQIPFALLPPTTDAAASYLRHLLPRPAPDIDLAPVTPEAVIPEAVIPEVAIVAAELEESDAAERLGDERAAGGGGERDAAAERPVDPRSRPVEAAGRGGVEAVELPPQQLQVSAAEVDFMARLGPLLPTPRAAKRLVNVYRLVRIGVRSGDLAAFVGEEEDGGPYQAVQVLLAILVGHPEFARKVFQLVIEGAGGESEQVPFTDLVAVAAAAGRSGGNTPSFGIVHSLLIEIRRDSPLSVSIREGRRWCPRLARFSFYTRDLAGRHLDVAAGP